ncbi:MAG: nitronate monooxygenase family protein [Ketobacteraceae bacterium]|nr:nitronate monooxygenase family protein [Ketobacteraceae bacterium]
MPLPAVLQNSLRLPLIGSPLFIISNPTLVMEQCKAGIMGSFPSLNARPLEVLDQWLTDLNRDLAQYKSEHPDRIVAPYAVNLICHQSNNRLYDDVELCVKHKVPVIITSLRAPADLVERIHSYGGVILHDVTNIRHARKAVEEGVDGLILVCAGAGGHAGELSPFALVQEVRGFYDGCVVLSGAISNGRAILAAQAMGCDLAYMGSRFIATREAQAPDEYKQCLVESAADDIVYTNLFTGVHGNYLKPSILQAGLDPHNLPESDKTRMNFGSGGNTAAKAWKDIWGSGQGIGDIHDIPPAGELIDRLYDEYQQAKVALSEAWNY